MNDFSIKGQGDPSGAQSATQTQAPNTTQGSSSNFQNSIILNSMISSFLSTNGDNNSDADSTQATGSQEDPDDLQAPSGLSDSQRIANGGGAGEKEGGEGAEGKEENKLGFEGGDRLTTKGPLSTSANQNVTEGIDLRSIEAMGVANAQSTKNFFIPLNTASYSNSINDMSSNFANAAGKFGFSSDVSAQVTASLQKAGNLANQLNILSSQGLATQQVTTKFSSQIQNSLASAATVLAANLAKHPSVLAGAFTEYFGIPPTAAQNMAAGYVTLTGNQTSSSDSTAAYNPLDDTAGITMEAAAVGSFAANVANGTALMDAYEADIYTINANIGSDTAEESNATNQNTQNQIKKNEQEEEKEKREKRKQGLLGQIFHPVQSLVTVISPVMVNVGAGMIHSIDPNISKQQAAEGLKGIGSSPLSKLINNGISKGENAATNAGADALCKMIPGLSKSDATEFLNTGFKLMSNPWGESNILGLEALGQVIELADPSATNSVQGGEKVADSLINDQEKMTSPTSTPQEKIQASSAMLGEAMSQTAQGITNLICLADPSADKNTVLLSVTIALMALAIIASFFIGPEALAAPEAEVGVMAEGEVAVEASTSTKTDMKTFQETEEVLDTLSNVVDKAEGQGGSSSSGNSDSASNTLNPASNAVDNAALEEDITQTKDAEEASAATPQANGAQGGDKLDGNDPNPVAGPNAVPEGDGSAANPSDDEVDSNDPDVVGGRNAVVEGDGSAEDAADAANGFEKRIKSEQYIARGIQLTAVFQGIGSVLTNVLTILESVQQIQIANLEYQIQVNSSILSLLEQTETNTNTATTNLTQAINTNISNENTANGIMAQDASQIPDMPA